MRDPSIVSVIFIGNSCYCCTLQLDGVVVASKGLANCCIVYSSLELLLSGSVIETVLTFVDTTQ